MKPNYQQIYSDIIDKKYPHKKDICKTLLNKSNLSAIDIIMINQKIFDISSKENERFNRQHRSYKKSDIVKMLDYQEKNSLNNTQLAYHFKLSRNTVAKWKKMFL